MKRSIVAFLTGAVVTAMLVFGGIMIWRAQKMTKVHILEAPMLLTSPSQSKNMHLLPKGTVLYFDKAYPEGFVRYKVYINIDRLPLPLATLDDPTLIDPIEATKPTSEELRKLLNNYPLTRDDLAAILKSSAISKEEIKKLLLEYSQ
jgi:hypothetical protein